MKTVRSWTSRILIFFLWAAVIPAGGCRSQPDQTVAKEKRLARVVKIGNYHLESPYGIAIVVDDQTGFLIDPEWEAEGGKTDYFEKDKALVPPGVAAPDFSYFQASFKEDGANVVFTWGRSGPGNVVATLSADKPVRLTFKLSGGWPRFHNVFNATRDGLTGFGVMPEGRYVPFALRCDPAPTLVEANHSAEARIIFAVEPGSPVRIAAGLDDLPALESVETTLETAGTAYAARRTSAEGDWGDFLGAIADNLNTMRFYGSDNGRIAHGDGRGWWLYRGSPDTAAYFVWDYFFHAALASLEDPASARDTVRAVLSFATPSGFIPSYAHWDYYKDYVTMDRSMPPVGSMCVWKMHQRWPDTDFLAEVYPRLVRWHDWWPTARDGNRNGLLEWGSERKHWQAAQWETGQDDNLHFEGAEMAGTTMNADAVDLSSMWSMDAEFLAKIALALGRAEDARRFEREHSEMNDRINDRLWNEELGIYCSRYWEIPVSEGPGLDPEKLFVDRLNAVLFEDRDLSREALRRRDANIDFDWGEGQAAEGLPVDEWSARWSGQIQVPKTGEYRLKTRADDGVRVWLDGELVIDDWQAHWEEPRHLDLRLESGKTYPITVEYFDADRMASLRLTVHEIAPGSPGDDWLTRITPMNFYPLICGVPDTARAERVLAWIYQEDKFWGRFLLPTLAYDDPDWYQQTYWRGYVWPSANYLVWQGLLRYADSAHRVEYARRSVDLFMRNWVDRRQCCENYYSTDGTCGDHPHYAWGALLCLIGAESLVDIGPDLKPVSRDVTGLTERIVMRRVPFGGNLYRIDAASGRITVSAEQ
jgi:putative isomerase